MLCYVNFIYYLLYLEYTYNYIYIIDFFLFGTQCHYMCDLGVKVGPHERGDCEKKVLWEKKYIVDIDYEFDLKLGIDRYNNFTYIL